jgi:hypothetical protein
MDPTDSQATPVDPVKDKENMPSSPSKELYWRRLAEKLLNNCWGCLHSWGTAKSGNVGVFVFVVEADFLFPCFWPAFGSQPPGVSSILPNSASGFLLQMILGPEIFGASAQKFVLNPLIVHICQEI